MTNSRVLVTELITFVLYLICNFLCSLSFIYLRLEYDATRLYAIFQTPRWVELLRIRHCRMTSLIKATPKDRDK
jgi:hypothetical protein